MPPHTSSPFRSRRHTRGVVVCLSWLALVSACSSDGPPAVNPRPLGDGGIAERTLLEAGSGDALLDGASDSASDAAWDVGSSVGGQGAGGALGADGGWDPADVLPAAQLAVTVLVPDHDNAVVKAKDRFVPTVQVSVTLPAGAAPDDLAGVVAELWPTTPGPTRISSTPLTVSGRIGAESSRVTTYILNDAAVDLSAVASGIYELRIIASSTGQVTSQSSRLLKVDAGPSITVTSPVAKKAYRGSLGIQVRIEDPLFGPVSHVVMSLGAYVLPNVVVSSPPLDYQVTVTTTDTIPPLDGAQLLKISAENANGTVNAVTVPFVFDSTGPAISDTSPATGQLIGGVITIKASVMDPSGVDPTSVIAVMAHGNTQFEVKLVPDAVVPNLFGAQFDTRLFDLHAVYPTISFRAADVPGNQSSVGYQVELDNTPPISDLDPPRQVRLSKKNATGEWECSSAFDPLGSDAVSDGDMVTQLFDIRARVQDLGNEPVAGGQDIMPVSLVDPSQVQLLVLDDTSQPLVVDSDGDGFCDKINPMLVPTSLPMSSRDALLVNLAPVPPGGNANFAPDASLVGNALGCVQGTDSGQPPAPLCLTTDLGYALSYTEATEPAIWTIPPVVSGSLKCVGLQFDSFANHVNDGVACLAVRAADKLGNVQVSKVVRICIDHDRSGGDCPGFHAATSIAGGASTTVTTASGHGLATGDTVIVSGAITLPAANGKFTVTVVDATHFSLNGVAAGSSAWSNTAVYTTPGELPDCTGIQTAIQPPAVSSSRPCTPWRSYADLEVIRQY
jgi:hypothetical protein